MASARAIAIFMPPQILEGEMQKAHREGTTDVETKSEIENFFDCTAIRRSPA
jgi:hypothetical protein